MTVDEYNLRSVSCIALGGLLFGYIIGITSNVVTTGQLQCPAGYQGPKGTWTSVGYRQCYDFTSLQSGILISLNLLGACLSSLCCFRYADVLGRKKEVQIGAVLYFVGAAVAAFGPVLWATYLGFGLYGLGIGFAMHAAPVYIAEIAPARVRGTLIAAKEVLIVLGMVLGFGAGAIFVDMTFQGWRCMTALAMLFALVMGVGIAAVPESPRFLVRQELLGSCPTERTTLRDEARASLEYFRQGLASEEVDRELAGIREELRSTVSSADESSSLCTALQYPRPLVVGCGLVLLQQVTGQPAVLYYATGIFKSAGFGSNAAVSSLSVGFVKLVATIFAASRVDEYGRKPLLLCGIAMMTVALAMISTSMLFRSCAVAGRSVWECSSADIVMPQSWSAITVLGLMLYVSGYQVGFGPISWLMIAEVFPLSVRGSALSLAALVNFGSNLVMTMLQGLLEDALSPSGLFIVYLGFCLLSFQFVRALVPETRGKSLEQIEHEMVVGPTAAPAADKDV